MAIPIAAYIMVAIEISIGIMIGIYCKNVTQSFF